MDESIQSKTSTLPEDIVREIVDIRLSVSSNHQNNLATESLVKNATTSAMDGSSAKEQERQLRKEALRQASQRNLSPVASSSSSPTSGADDSSSSNKKEDPRQLRKEALRQPSQGDLRQPLPKGKLSSATASATKEQEQEFRKSQQAVGVVGKDDCSTAKEQERQQRKHAILVGAACQAGRRSPPPAKAVIKELSQKCGSATAVSSNLQMATIRHKQDTAHPLRGSETSLNSSVSVGAHRIRGMDSTSLHSLEDQIVSKNSTGDDNESNFSDEEASTPIPPPPSLEYTVDATLVTATEVCDASSEEFREKEAQMEEQIKQKLMSSAVQADVVSPVLGEEDEDEKVASLKRRQPWIVVGAISCVVVLGVIVGVLVVVLAGDEEKLAQAQQKMTNDVVVPEVTEAPSEEGSLVLPSMDTVIAQVPETICYERIPLFRSSELCKDQDLELGSSVTNMVAASRLWNFPEVDISIVNAGEVWGDLAPGDFTVENATNLMPWDNTLVVLQIDGKALVVAMERALQKLVDDYSLLKLNETISGGAYPYGAGIRYEVNMSESFPNRLSKVEVNPRLSQDKWEPIKFDQQYSVVTNSYLAGGGDAYNEFHRLPAEAVNNTGIHSLTAFLDYCDDVHVLEEPPLSQFSTQAYTNTLYDWYCGCVYDW